MSPRSSDLRSSLPRRAVIKTFTAGALASAFTSAGWMVSSAAPAFEMGMAPVFPAPVKLVLVFGHPEDEELFEGHYRTVHLPLVMRLPKCSSMESALAVGDMDGKNASFYRISTLTFASNDDMVSCMSSAAGLAAIADIANFASGGVTATVVSDIQTRGFRADDAPSTTVDVPLRYEQRRPD